MKRYIQACEVGGSIYGKKRANSHNGNRPNSMNQRGKEDSAAEYASFYKKQFCAMGRFFKRGE